MTKGKTPIKLSLLQNSERFTEESIRNAVQAENDPARWQFAMMHLVQAIELCLKGVLEGQHPALVFDDIDKPKRMVGIWKAVRRIQRYARASLSDSDINHLHECVDVRNEVVHAAVEFVPDQMKARFSKLCGLLQELIARFFEGEHLSDSIDKSLWQEFVKIREHVKELQARAAKALREMSEDQLVPDEMKCPICGAETLYFPDPKYADVKCCCCGFGDQLWQCDRCHRDFFESQQDPEETAGQRFCWECHEENINDGDYWFHYKRDGGEI